MRARNIQASEIRAAEEGIFNKMAEILPMIIDSKKRKCFCTSIRFRTSHFMQMIGYYFCLFPEGSESLRFEPSEVFFGKNVIVTCGPPPTDFSANWRAEWFLNGTQIQEDDNHISSIQDGAAILRVPKFFEIDNGKELITAEAVFQHSTVL